MRSYDHVRRLNLINSYKFEKHGLEQIDSETLRKAVYKTFFRIHIFSDTKFPQTFPDSKVPDLYLICDHFVSDSCSLG
jgi:hypothetical protein